MSYYEDLHHLLQLKLVTLKEMPPLTNKVPTNFNANARCDYHSGGMGHDVENYWALKYKVYEMLDSKAVQFTLVNAPNVIQNPTPVHVAAANMVEVVYTGEHLNLIIEVGELATPLLAIKEYLVEYSVYPGCSAFCEDCQKSDEGCGKLKVGIQYLLDMDFL